MIQYFGGQSLFDFKDSRKFWQFYISCIKMKSDSLNNILPISIILNGKVMDGLQNVCDAFNFIFSSLSP
jgi:hypothetical protein